jgi:hypothetical protein
VLPVLLQVQDVPWARSFANTIAAVPAVNNATKLAPEAIKMPDSIHAAAWLVKDKQWSRAYDVTCAAAVLPIHPGQQAIHALAPGAVELLSDLSFPEDCSGASFKAHATTCQASLLEESCPDQQQALAALWAHLATCPGPVQEAMEAPQPQVYMCAANWTTPASPAVAPDAKEEQAVCPAANFLGANTTTAQPVENNTDTVYTPNTYQKFSTWSVCAVALCTLAGILALALRRSTRTPPAPKKKMWDLELLQVMAKCLTGDPAKDARWARRQGEEGEGVELLEAIRAAGLYPSPPAKPPTPPRVAPKNSTPASKQSSPKQSKPRHQPKPTPPVPTPPTATPASRPATMVATQAAPPATPPPVILLRPQNPWAPLPSPCRRRTFTTGNMSKGEVHRYIQYHKALSYHSSSSTKKKPATPKPPVAPKSKTSNRHPPTDKPIAFFAKPARAAVIAALPSPGKAKPQQAPLRPPRPLRP